MLPDGTFRGLLLLLVSGVSAGIVLPPTNLTVSCDNLNVIASWQYSRQQPNTRFIVHFKGLARNDKKETTDHHVDLSQFVWESAERYMEVHYVSVIAILGENQSEPVRSQTFSFNELRTSHIKCKLAFPPVDLEVDDSEATVSFKNPFYYYRELQQAVGKGAAIFEFNVTTADGKNVTGTCPVDQKKCRCEITYPEDMEKCVTLRGRLFDSKGIRYIEVFNETGPICPDTTTAPHIILLLVLLIVTSMVVIGIIVSICLTKSWTMKKEEPSIPDFLMPGQDIKKPYFTVPENDYSTVILMGKPRKNLSVSSEEDDNLQDSKDGSEVHVPDSNYGEGGLLENSSQQLELGCSRSDDDSADDSVKTEIFMIDMEEEKDEEKETGEDEEKEHEEERSPYDSPQNLQLNMGNGDTGKGYQKR
ncbi:interferon gamma receptor 1 [Tautogolabrus adspersus]